MIYKDIFTQLGLSENEAIVFEFLLNTGETTAGEIIKTTPLKRGVVYNALADLIDKSLINKINKVPRDAKSKQVKKIAYFSPNHPQKLKEYLETQEKTLQKAKNTLEANLPALVSAFNLVSGKPGVKYFEGIEGIKKVLEDTLTSRETIMAYSDIVAIYKYISGINREYVRKREKLKIKKRGIIIDSPKARKILKNYHPTITENKFIDSKLFPFNSIMQIYDGKVAYITLSDKNMIGVIIEDKNIYQMHKSIFEHTWKHAKTLDQLEHSKAK